MKGHYLKGKNIPLSVDNGCILFLILQRKLHYTGKEKGHQRELAEKTKIRVMGQIQTLGIQERQFRNNQKKRQQQKIHINAVWEKAFGSDPLLSHWELFECKDQNAYLKTEKCVTYEG